MQCKIKKFHYQNNLSRIFIVLKCFFVSIHLTGLIWKRVYLLPYSIALRIFLCSLLYITPCLILSIHTHYLGLDLPWWMTLKYNVWRPWPWIYVTLTLQYKKIWQDSTFWYWNSQIPISCVKSQRIVFRL